MRSDNVQSVSTADLMKILPLVGLSILLFSCKETVVTPADLIPRDKMEKVLLDVNIAEVYSGTVKDTLRRPGTKNPDSLARYYKEIFKHYKITPEQFSNSLTWYKSHPEDLDSVYSNMIPAAARWQATPVAPPPAPANVSADHK